MILRTIAFRNIFRQRRRSILTGLTITGGFILLSLSLAILEGTYGKIIDTFTRMKTGHIQINGVGYLEKPTLYNTLDNIEELGVKLDTQKKIKSWTPRVLSTSLAFAGTKTTAARIIGVDPERETRTTNISQKVESGNFITGPEDNSIVLSSGMAEVLKVNLGDEIVLITQAADGSIANDIFHICGLFGKSSDSSERMNCYMHINKAQEFLALYGRVHEIAVVTTSYKKAVPLSISLRKSLNIPDIEIQPWQEVEKQFYKAMQADIKGMWVTLFIIMVIVGIGVLNTVLMTILERTREYGVLKALGTKPGSIFKLIVYETFFLTLISCFAGIIISLVINYIFSLYGISYPEPVDVGGIMITKMQAEITFRSIWIPCMITFITAMVVSIFPAVRAAKVVPVKAMRAH